MAGFRIVRLREFCSLTLRIRRVVIQAVPLCKFEITHAVRSRRTVLVQAYHGSSGFSFHQLEVVILAPRRSRCITPS